MVFHFLTVPKQQVPIHDTITEEEFYKMMDKGIQQVKNNESEDMKNVFD